MPRVKCSRMGRCLETKSYLAAVWSSRPLSSKSPNLFGANLPWFPKRGGGSLSNRIVKITARLALLIALNVVLTRLLSFRISIGGVEGVRLGFGALPTILAGIVYGPAAGFVVGALADLVGYWINPIGGYNPVFTLTSALTGFIPGAVIFYMFQRGRKLWQLIIAIALGQITTSIILVPFFLKLFFGIPIMASMIPKIVSEAITVPVYASFIGTLLRYDIFDMN